MFDGLGLAGLDSLLLDLGPKGGVNPFNLDLARAL